MTEHAPEPWLEHATLHLDELPDPGAREFLVGAGDWPFRGLLVRRGDEVRAFANVCPHKGHPLNLADDDFFTADGELLRCASHGALFAPDSGLCVLGPCAGRNLRQLDSRISDGRIWVRAPQSWEALGTE